MIRACKMVFLCCCMLLCAGGLTAQEFTPELVIGGRAGGTASFMSFSPSVSQGIHFGPSAGVAVRYISEKYFGLQVEANYVQKGWTEPASNNYSRTLNYIEIPFLSHITFGKRMFRWFFNLGPNISYLVAEKSYGTNLQESTQLEQTLPVKNYFDYGICLGTGFEFRTRGGIYQLEARYNYGLGNIFSSASTSDIRLSSNQNVTLNIAALFPIKKKTHK